MTRPNILYIHSHDTGRYTQPYGHATPTPRIQQLAREGVVFRQAFCAAPTCSPSRAALLTGQAPHSAGMLGLAHRGWRLHDYGQHIAHTLRSAGYRSFLAGVQHIAARPAATPEDIGYDRILKAQPGNSGEGIAAAAAALLQSDEPGPFFLDVGFFETHRVFPEPGPQDDARWVRPPAPLPDTPETRADMAAFHASARILDGNIGRVLDALEASGRAENTLVICTTDHGIAFPGMKCSLTDHGIGVQLIMRGPNGFSGGRIVDVLVSQIDLFPTLCDLLQIERPEWLQGVSLMPLIHQQATEVREELFAEVSYHAAYEPMRCVRTRRWKYIRRFDGRERIVRPNCDESPSRTVWLDGGWYDQACAGEALFDLLLDPNETNNRAADPRYVETLDQMRRRLERWMRNTDDPLLQGPIPLPPGAIANDPDQFSPNDPIPGAA